MNLNAWNEIVSGLSNPDVPTCADAASKLYASATPQDIPRLLSLLDSDDFFVREAAAGPLAALAGPAVLPQLLKAYQRGFDEGHDNPRSQCHHRRHKPAYCTWHSRRSKASASSNA
jgi:HEAT repeat protein